MENAQPKNVNVKETLTESSEKRKSSLNNNYNERMMEPTGRMVFFWVGFPAPIRTEPDWTGNWKKRTLCSCRIVPSKQQQQKKNVLFLLHNTSTIKIIIKHNKYNNNNSYKRGAQWQICLPPFFIIFLFHFIFFFGIVDATRAEINCDFAITTTTMK